MCALSLYLLQRVLETRTIDNPVLNLQKVIPNMPTQKAIWASRLKINVLIIGRNVSPFYHPNVNTSLVGNVSLYFV